MAFILFSYKYHQQNYYFKLNLVSNQANFKCIYLCQSIEFQNLNMPQKVNCKFFPPIIALH